MCGIFGLTVDEGSIPDRKKLRRAFDALVRLSESRGKEAAGVAVWNDDGMDVFKGNLRGSKFIKTRNYKKLLKKDHRAIIGHTRLVTNGSMERHENNQPVVREGIVAIHNGIIVNDEEIFGKYAQERNSEVDTEALIMVLAGRLKNGGELKESVLKSLGEMKGEVSAALLFSNRPALVLATNNGSLYVARHGHGMIFASERYILERIRRWLNIGEISKVLPGSLEIELLSSSEGGKMNLPIRDAGADSSDIVPALFDKPDADLLRKYDLSFEENSKSIAALKRCAKCILPETMPFIEFDENGICNYCRNYKKKEIQDEERLLKIADAIRKNDGSPDCIFPLSGGRDSSYGLHYVKSVLMLNPITYSYDWGMLTDLGRRNQARMSGSLGVEHLWLSADIAKKRENIRKNVLAWLKKPDLGTIPLFMAGDKQYFYYLNKLKKQLGIKHIFYCENSLEKTDFKFGFCGIPPKSGLKHVYHLGLGRKISLALYYLKRFISNPSYINSSILDSLGAYISTYFIPHDYIFLYDYIPWDEKRINEALIGNYDWEISPDTPTTWRIGDGTAAFYNYIYYTAAGFTENDTFRSNQIREGMTSREKALELASKENDPRWESIQWYCDTIGIDFRKTLDTINKMPKLYASQKYEG